MWNTREHSILSNRNFFRVVWIVQACMLTFESAWLAIVYVVRPAPGSVLESLPQYLRILGGNSRFTLPIGVFAFLRDYVLSKRAVSEESDAGLAWIGISALTYSGLWVIGALVVVVLAFTFSWH